MAKFLRDFGIYDRTDNSRDLKTRQRLSMESRCILANFERHLSKYDNLQGIKKLNVEIVKNGLQAKPVILLGCLQIQISFNLKSYFNAENLDKKKMILEMLWQGILIAVKTFKWDISPFQDAKDAVIDSNYTYHWTWKRPKLNPSKQYKAEIFCEHEIDYFRISLVIRTDTGDIIRNIHLIDEKPSEFIFVKYFGILEWKSENEISFVSRDKTIVWTYNIDKNTLDKKTSK
jgi:hypothetical protein